jgi:hypothetical protein
MRLQRVSEPLQPERVSGLTLRTGLSGNNSKTLS